jgi:hypothetical protein
LRGDPEQLDRGHVLQPGRRGDAGRDGSLRLEPALDGLLLLSAPECLRLLLGGGRLGEEQASGLAGHSPHPDVVTDHFPVEASRQLLDGGGQFKGEYASGTVVLICSMGGSPIGWCFGKGCRCCAGSVVARKVTRSRPSLLGAADHSASR